MVSTYDYRYTGWMEINLTWEDLVQLGQHRKIEKGNVTVTLSRDLLPTFKLALKNRTGSSVLFTVDDLSTPNADGTAEAQG